MRENRERGGRGERVLRSIIMMIVTCYVSLYKHVVGCGHHYIKMATVERLEEKLNCPICLDQYKDPKILPCHHSFCTECLKEVAAINIDGKNTLNCPSCRKSIDIPMEGIIAFPNSFVVNDFLELLQKTGQQGDSNVTQNNEQTPLPTYNQYGHYPPHGPHDYPPHGSHDYPPHEQHNYPSPGPHDYPPPGSHGHHRGHRSPRHHGHRGHHHRGPRGHHHRGPHDYPPPGPHDYPPPGPHDYPPPGPHDYTLHGPHSHHHGHRGHRHHGHRGDHHRGHRGDHHRGPHGHHHRGPRGHHHRGPHGHHPPTT